MRAEVQNFLKFNKDISITYAHRIVIVSQWHRCFWNLRTMVGELTFRTHYVNDKNLMDWKYGYRRSQNRRAYGRLTANLKKNLC